MNEERTPKSTALAEELHDGVCQTLTAVHLHASVLAHKLSRACPDLAPDLQKIENLIERARAELDAVVKRVG